MNKELEENKNNNFSLEAKFESMIKTAKEIIKENNNNSDCSMEIALAYDVANYLPKILENSIPKEKVEKKIEILKMEEHYDYIDNKKAITVLQELLEGK